MCLMFLNFEFQNIEFTNDHEHMVNTKVVVTDSIGKFLVGIFIYFKLFRVLNIG
jgi:hypothetical protein